MAEIPTIPPISYEEYIRQNNIQQGGPDNYRSYLWNTGYGPVDYLYMPQEAQASIQTPILTPTGPVDSFIQKPSFKPGPENYSDYDYINQEAAPEYQNLIPSRFGTLGDENTLRSRVGRENLDALTKYATGGESPWLKATRQGISDEKTAELGRLGQYSSSATQSAKDQLASRRGLSMDASGRLEQQGALAQMMGAQGIKRDAYGSDLSAQLSEANQQQSLLSQLPQMEMDYAQNAQAIQGTNIKNLMDERQRQYAYNLDKWKTSEGIKSAERLARTQMMAGQDSGGFFSFLK